jgi:hypothetical protein
MAGPKTHNSKHHFFDSLSLFGIEIATTEECSHTLFIESLKCEN